MEINRNQYFMAGLVFLVLGLQFRMVDSFVLSEEATEFVAKRMDKPVLDKRGSSLIQLPGKTPVGRRVVKPPEWTGWALISLGSVLILHSFAMRRPD